MATVLDTYGRQTHFQSAIAFASSEVARAARQTVLSATSGPILMADYGCADGRNSFPAFSAAIEAFRECTSRPFVCVHVDLPGTNFDALFKTVQEAEGTYLTKDKFAYPVAIARSFYDQVLPTASVSLGWSSMSINWMRGVPGPIPGNVFYGCASARERAVWAESAARDWRLFLARRAGELQPGARLITLSRSAAPDRSTGTEGVYNLANSILWDMVICGVIPRGVYERMILPYYFASLDELTDAAGHPDVACLFIIEAGATYMNTDLLRVKYEADGDAGAYAASYIKRFRTYTQPSLASAFKDSGLEEAVVFSELYDRLTSELSRQIHLLPKVRPIAVLRLLRRHGEGESVASA